MLLTNLPICILETYFQLVESFEENPKVSVELRKMLFLLNYKTTLQIPYALVKMFKTNLTLAAENFLG